jgi:hypothetical protein
MLKYKIKIYLRVIIHNLIVQVEKEQLMIILNYQKMKKHIVYLLLLKMILHQQIKIL